MTTVCIIGAGELGGAVAHALARGEHARRVVLIEDGSTIAAGKALDIRQAGAVEGFDTRVDGDADLTRVAGCAVCVIADRPAPRHEHRSDPDVATMMQLKGLIGSAPIVCAGAGDADLLLEAVRDAGFNRRCVVGSAPEALVSAARSIVALEAHGAPADVALAVLGTPPSGFVVPWSEVSIGGYSVERLLSQSDIRRLDARIRRLWPPGPHALGLAAARVVEALVRSARRTFNVLAVLDGEFGVQGRVAVLPSQLGPTGIVRSVTPALEPRERIQLDTALALPQ